MPPGQTVLQLPSRGGLSAWTPVWGAVGEGRETRVAGAWPWLGLQPPPLSGLRAGTATLANGQANGSSQLELRFEVQALGGLEPSPNDSQQQSGPGRGRCA